MSEFAVKEKLTTTLEMKESGFVTKIAAADEISTPEKPIQLPRRPRVAFSVKEVKEATLGLQKPHKDSSDRRSDLGGSGAGGDDDDDLLAVEEELKSASSSSDLLHKSPKTKSPAKKLPDKYEILLEFFNSMDCSIRLLRLKRSLPTFANICSSIQHLTGRRFTYGHLSQLKYLLPEAISIKKVILHDEATCCMKPELQIYLQTDAIESSRIKQKEESGYSILRRVFRQRLLNFSREHPEVDDIPEDELPYPFSHQTKPNTPSDIAGDSTCFMPINSTVDTQQVITMASHIPKSFQRWFSQKTVIPDTDKTSLVCFDEVTTKDDSHVPIVTSPIKWTSRPTICRKPLFASPVPKASSSSHSCKRDRTLINAETQSPQKLNYFDGTPAKFVCTPTRLMTATPKLQTPKRYRPTTAYDTPVKEPEKQSARTKLLFSTPQRSTKPADAENVIISVSDDDDVINILPETLLQEIREKERKAEEERDTGGAEARRRKEMVASLPKLFDMILLIFQSGNRSFITKKELVQKIIAGYFSIVDRSEVEQQLKLLQELAPDWISAKVVLTGDFLYSVNRISSPQEIRQRLAEAK